MEGTEEDGINWLRMEDLTGFKYRKCKWWQTAGSVAGVRNEAGN